MEAGVGWGGWQGDHLVQVGLVGLLDAGHAQATWDMLEEMVTSFSCTLSSYLQLNPQVKATQCYAKSFGTL